MHKYLITGFSGFVSQYFLNFLEEQETQASVLGVDFLTPAFSTTHLKNIRCHFEKIDLLHKEDLGNAIYRFQPNYVLHLASYSSVAYSWKNPLASFANNTNILLNLLETIRLNNIDCRILSIGSSEEYGNVAASGLPLRESSPVDPVSPYAVARVSQEMLSKIYIQGYKLDIIMTRSFNHVGPGQKDIFAVSSFAKQLVAIARENRHQGQLRAGDIKIIRDFIDVRDVVAAYFLLLKKGKCGDIYNVCSGKGTALSEVIDIMAGKLKLNITIEPDPSLFRPSDNRIVVGCNEKIKRDTGWENKIVLEKSLEDIVAYWMHLQENNGALISG